ncbi:protein-glutamate O-methyltransferase CheR [Microcoleus sp. FACHB-68]|uniref:CheR family methyltransferase n=1 Tax=Microcoleus sp. FACHB-68 TaxID=2692826 RepID=UPI0016890412|nr:protein-glutamate O-methyltransferase CheR [Microcoleus sp. FACHB-68]MBD1938769.1 protein-glutamate O-methyltransferase CheR [Microcoleus sp. FACHB-68]
MSISSDDFNYICQLLRDQTAISLEADKAIRVERQLAPIAQQAGFSSIEELVALLRTQQPNELHIQVIEAMLLSETSFFRDNYPFEALKKVLLPQFLKQRLSERSLNIWSAACSTGQEPYSIAMLLHQYFPIFAGWNVRFIASDISGEILTRAREGRYTQLEIHRGLTAAQQLRYFQQQDNEWQLKQQIRQMVEFRQINLAAGWPTLPLMDIIFMRNVLIYFDVATKKAILAKLRQVLSPDGYLFLGASETTITLDNSFEPVYFDKALCYRLRR